MKKQSEILKAKQIAHFDAAQAILAKAKDDKGAEREMTAEEKAAFDLEMEAGNAFTDKIASAEKSEATLAALEKPKARVTTDNNPAALTTGVHERAIDNPTRGYDGAAGFGRFAADVHRLNSGQGMADGLKIFAAAGDGMSAGIKSDGGVLLPPAFSTTIMDLVGMDSDPLLSEVDNLPPLPDNCESMEYPAINESSRADGSRKGGIRGYWKAELTTMTESKPTLKDIKFSPQEVYVFAYASDKLLRHAPQLSSFLSTCAADEINFKLGDSIINGTGSGMPRGILTGATDAPRVQIAKETGQAAATLVVNNLAKMYARMPAKYLPGAKWYVNVDTLPQFLLMAFAVGTGGIPIYMPGGSIANAPYGTIYGAPVVPLEYSQTLGTEGDIIFANMKRYAMQTRGTVESGMSIHLKFDINQTAFRFIFEADGQPWNATSITPKNGSNKQSPFVTLQSRS